MAFLFLSSADGSLGLATVMLHVAKWLLTVMIMQSTGWQEVVHHKGKNKGAKGKNTRVSHLKDQGWWSHDDLTRLSSEF